MYEIRIHSRGGQGGVTAARMIATAAVLDGKFATACPFYGAERRGAPVVSFVRINSEPVKIYSQIHSPDMVIILDQTIMDTINVLDGLKKGGSMFINTCNDNIKFPDDFTVFKSDLTGIAIQEKLIVSGNPILNTPLIGAMSRIGIFTQKSGIDAINELFSDDPRNASAAKKAYTEVT